jgi:hypothetical protein
MGHRIINDIQVTVSGDNISDEELSIYLSEHQAKYKCKIVKATVTVDGEFIDVKSTFEYVPFERIRRITGYLVGNTDRWCDAKRAEENDRVKHG